MTDEQLQEQNEELQGTISDLRSEVEKLEVQLEAARTENTNLKSSGADLVQQLNQLIWNFEHP